MTFYEVCDCCVRNTLIAYRAHCTASSPVWFDWCMDWHAFLSICWNLSKSTFGSESINCTKKKDFVYRPTQCLQEQQQFFLNIYKSNKRLLVRRTLIQCESFYKTLKMHFSSTHWTSTSTLCMKSAMPKRSLHNLHLIPHVTFIKLIKNLKRLCEEKAAWTSILDKIKMMHKWSCMPCR